MIPVKISGATKVLGPPASWRADVDGHCSRLTIREEKTGEGDTTTMVSAWQPSVDELTRLVNGASVYLGVLGTAHPPVYLIVGEAVGE